MDILIINPGSVEKKFQTEHLGIAGLKSWLIKEGFTADILDTSIEELGTRETVRRILALDPALLGLSALQVRVFPILTIGVHRCPFFSIRDRSKKTGF